MTKFKTQKSKIFAFWGAAFVLFIAVFTGCPQTADGGNTNGAGKPEAPFIEGGASLILSPDKLTIKVRAITADGTTVKVEGCTETTLASGGTYSELHARGTTVTLKGNIIELNFGDSSYNSSNKLTALNVQGLSALRGLICGNNLLTNLNVQGLTALKSLWCPSNQLTVLNVQGLSALRYLNCEENKLATLNVQGCTALNQLWCRKNQLTALNVQGLSSLRDLYCAHNQLTSLNVQGCTALNELWCQKNQLTELNVQGLSALQRLGCSENQLTALDIHGLSALRHLSCDSNQLNAQVFTKIFTDLPQRDAGANADCILYTERTNVTEGNHKDFTSASAPQNLKDAFQNAKTVKNWKMYKRNMNDDLVDLE